jgi:hypothetical protein
MIVPLDSRRKLIRRQPLKHDNLSPKRKLRLPRRPPAMTVRIAAIAAGGKAIVSVADSEVSFVRDGQTILKAD